MTKDLNTTWLDQQINKLENTSGPGVSQAKAHLQALRAVSEVKRAEALNQSLEEKAKFNMQEKNLLTKIGLEDQGVEFGVLEKRDIDVARSKMEIQDKILDVLQEAQNIISPQ